MKQQIRRSVVLSLTAVIVFSVGFFTLVFYLDNKYTTRAAVSQEGWTMLTQSDLSRPVYLADGWQLYPDVLLTPAQTAGGENHPVNTYVGEFLNLAPLHADRSPFGTSTWRLRVRYDGPAATGTLLLPEVFCSFRLYVNGQELAAQGSVYPYRPKVQDTCVSFPLLAENELVVQTANYTHYYSGLTYPPVLGTTQAVWIHTSTRLIFYGVLCFGTLAAALFSAAFWLGGGQRRDPMALLFGGLATGFAVWVSYPFSRLAGVPLIRPLYALEDTACMLAIWCALKIALRLCKLSGARWGRRLSGFAFAMLPVVATVPLLLLPALPGYAALYGKLLTGYRLLSGTVLATLALYGSVRKQAGSGWMLCGTGFFACALFAGALTVHNFEPARFGWFDEYGAFGLVVCFGALMVQRSFSIIRENGMLTGHLQEEVARKTRNMALLVHERDDLISKFLHDMKSPAAAMLSYAQMVRQNNVELDEQTLEQLAVIEEKCASLSNRVRQVQQFTVENPLITPKKEMNLCAFLQEFYDFSKPDVEMDGQNFFLELPSRPYPVLIDPDQLERLLQNLIYNAVSYTPAGGEIRLVLLCDDENAYLSVRDTGSGVPPEVLPKIFDRFYTTRTEEGGTGLGLYIVRTIAREHGGEVSVQSRIGEGACFTVRLPLLL